MPTTVKYWVKRKGNIIERDFKTKASAQANVDRLGGRVISVFVTASYRRNRPKRRRGKSKRPCAKRRNPQWKENPLCH